MQMSKSPIISGYVDWAGFELTTSMVIGTDCIGIPGSFKSNYHTITTTTTPSEKYFSVCNEIQQFNNFISTFNVV